MLARRVLTLLLAVSSTFVSPSALLADETVSQPDQRMAWWRDAKFGMFIHWGVYAVPAGRYEDQHVPGIGEWILRNAKVPVATYRGYAERFDPVNYDPAAWAALAKQAGMRYVVITAKHHDGFSLYDSAASDWDIADASPYGEDLIGPLADAVRAEGLKFGLYYSQAQDWVHPGGAKMGYPEGGGWDPAHEGDYDDYLQQIAVPQTEEILTRYRPDVLWWDTPVWMTTERAAPLDALLAKQPTIITNNRLGGGYQGDTETPEQHIPATGYADRDWETCMTMNDTWGFKSDDLNWKSTETLLHNLVDIASKGGNYLLNVGPTADGVIPPESIERLQAIGRWMDANGAAIYGTTASPCRQPAWGRLTRKRDRLYLHVFDWPTDGRLAVPVRVATGGCRLLAAPEREFAVSDSPEGLVVRLDGSAIDPICTVIELEIQGQPVEVVHRTGPIADGGFRLDPADAVTRGGLQVEEIGGLRNLGYWVSPADTALWRLKDAAPGAYELVAEVAGPGATRFAVETADAAAPATVAPTGDYHRFERQTLGRVRIDQPGEATVVLRPEPDGWNAFNLRTLELRPVD